jgi:hypothetical protein
MQRYVAGPERVLGKVSRVQLSRVSLREEWRQLYLRDVPLDKLLELGYCSGLSSFYVDSRETRLVRPPTACRRLEYQSGCCT